MRLKTLFLIGIILMSFSLTAVHGQAIKGQVLDSLSGEPIPYAHIYSPKTRLATVSNDVGEFTIYGENVQSIDSLYFSHISHDPLKIAVEGQEDLVIKMIKSTLILEDVVIREDAQDIALLALKHLKNSRLSYSKVFYRQITTVANEPSEFIEVFYNSALKRSGFEQIEVDQARYARKKETDFRFTNFSFLTMAFPVYKEKSNQVIPPFSDKLDEYSFRLEKRFIKGSDTYVQVNCVPPILSKLEDTTQLYLEAEFTFNVTKNRLVEYQWFINHALGADKIIVSKKKGDVEVRNPNYHWQVSFSESENSSEYGIDFINVSYNFDLLINDEIKPTVVSSTTLVYEKNIKKSKKLKSPEIAQDDLITAQKAKYKPKFWRDNPVIQLTAEQEKMIITFEKANSFGSYFK